MLVSDKVCQLQLAAQDYKGSVRILVHCKVLSRESCTTCFQQRAGEHDNIID